MFLRALLQSCVLVCVDVCGNDDHVMPDVNVEVRVLIIWYAY